MMTVKMRIEETEFAVRVSADFEGKPPVEDRETEAVADLFVYFLRRLRKLEPSLPKPLVLESPLDGFWEESEARLKARKNLNF